MKKGYRVYDKRNDATYFEGTEGECMEWLLKTYPVGEEGSEHMIVGINYDWE